MIADNASAARYALGNPVSPDEINLRTVGCVFTKNGWLVATAAGAAVLDDPAEAIAWFVRKLSARGRHLEAGHALRGIPTEQIRLHTCYGLNAGPRIHDLDLAFIAPVHARHQRGRVFI